MGLAAALATTAQCFNGMYRTRLEVHDPLRKDELDTEEWYKETLYVLDAISLAGVGVTWGTTFKLLGVLKSSTGIGTMQSLKTLNSHQRKALTKELLLIRDPWITPKLMKLRQATGELPKRFTPAQFKNSTRIQIADCVSTIPDVVGSSMSGILNVVAVGLYQGVSND
jgi:hypothetical protein